MAPRKALLGGGRKRGRAEAEAGGGARRPNRSGGACGSADSHDNGERCGPSEPVGGQGGGAGSREIEGGLPSLGAGGADAHQSELDLVGKLALLEERLAVCAKREGELGALIEAASREKVEFERDREAFRAEHARVREAVEARRPEAAVRWSALPPPLWERIAGELKRKDEYYLVPFALTCTLFRAIALRLGSAEPADPDKRIELFDPENSQRQSPAWCEWAFSRVTQVRALSHSLPPLIFSV